MYVWPLILIFTLEKTVCEWSTDMSGLSESSYDASERYIDTPDKCAQYCKHLMIENPRINGVTFQVYPSKCWCEKDMRMKGKNLRTSSCFLKGVYFDSGERPMMSV